MSAKKLWRMFHRKIIHHDRRPIKIFISLETRSWAPTPNGDWWLGDPNRHSNLSLCLRGPTLTFCRSLLSVKIIQIRNICMYVQYICPRVGARSTNPIELNPEQWHLAGPYNPHSTSLSFTCICPSLSSKHLSLPLAPFGRWGAYGCLIELLPLLQHFSLSFRGSPFECLSLAG